MGLKAGTFLGQYEILSLLGVGGMGEVYRARDTKLNREVALKVLPEQFVRDPERIGRFRREAQVLAALDHPNIARIYAFEESGSARFLVMELVAGETLRERIKRQKSRSQKKGKRVRRLRRLRRRKKCRSLVASLLGMTPVGGAWSQLRRRLRLRGRLRRGWKRRMRKRLCTGT